MKPPRPQDDPVDDGGAVLMRQAPTTFPDRYGETYLVLMDVEPHTLLAYWEIDEIALERAQRDLAVRGETVVRVHDVTQIIFDGGNAHGHFDITVDAHVHNFYIYPSDDGRCFIADIGLRGADGKFVVLARSNCVQMPRAGRATDGQEKWMEVEGDPRQRQLLPRQAPVPLPPPTHALPESDIGLDGVDSGKLMDSVGREDVVEFYRGLWKDDN